MVYTQERLDHVYDVFRRSEAYRKRKGLIADKLDENLHKYKLRKPTSTAPVVRTSSLNDKDDSGDYDPSAGKKRVKPKDERQSQKTPQPKRKVATDNDGNYNDKSKRKKLKGTTYAQGRRLGKELILVFKVSSNKGRDLLLKLSNEHGTGQAHPRTAHVNIYTEDKPLLEHIRRDQEDEGPSSWELNGGSFYPTPRNSIGDILRARVRSRRESSSIFEDGKIESGVLGLRSKQIARYLEKKKDRKRKGECKDCEMAKKLCLHRNKDDESIMLDCTNQPISSFSSDSASGEPPNYLQNSFFHTRQTATDDTTSLWTASAGKTQTPCTDQSYPLTSYDAPNFSRSLQERLCKISNPPKLMNRPQISYYPHASGSAARPLSISSSSSEDDAALLFTPSTPTFRNTSTRSNADTFTNDTSILTMPSNWRSRSKPTANSTIDLTTRFHFPLPSPPASALQIPPQTKFIATNWAHPMNFHHPVSSPQPCHFHTDFRYGLFGCGLLQRVEVAISPTFPHEILFEVCGGHVGLGKEASRMCVECSRERLRIAQCGEEMKKEGIRGHVLGEMAEAEKVDVLRYIEMLKGNNNVMGHGVEGCKICVWPGAWRCVKRQEDNWNKEGREVEIEKGCGLVLCSKCASDFEEIGWDMEKLENRVKGRKGGKLRADSEFLWKRSALHVAWGIE